MAKQQINEETGEIKSYSFDPSAVKPKKMLNVPVLSQRGTGSIYVVILSKMFVGKPIESKDADAKEEPATIAYAVDLVTGTPVQIIVSTVLEGVLKESYVDHGYVDHAFKIENLGKLNGKRYNSVNVIEIDIPEGLDLAKVKELIVLPK